MTDAEKPALPPVRPGPERTGDAVAAARARIAELAARGSAATGWGR